MPADPAGGGEPGPRLDSLAIWKLEADTDGRTVVVIEPDRHLVVFRDGRRSASWALGELAERGGCSFDGRERAFGYVTLGVSADGAHAWFFGEEGRKDRSPAIVPTAACDVRLDTGAARPMQRAFGGAPALGKEALRDALPRLVYAARDGRSAVIVGQSDVEVVRRDTSQAAVVSLGLTDLHDASFAAGETQTGFVVAVFAPREHPRLFPVGIDLTQGEPVVTARAPVELPVDHVDLSAFSASGAALGLVGRSSSAPGSSLAVVDWPTLAITWIASPAGALPIAAFAFGPDGASVLLGAHDHVWAIGLDGAERARFSLPLWPDRLVLEAGGRRLWVADPVRADLYAWTAR